LRERFVHGTADHAALESFQDLEDRAGIQPLRALRVAGCSFPVDDPHPISPFPKSGINHGSEHFICAVRPVNHRQLVWDWLARRPIDRELSCKALANARYVVLQTLLLQYRQVPGDDFDGG
jgi:hypothetical protein